MNFLIVNGLFINEILGEVHFTLGNKYPKMVLYNNMFKIDKKFVNKTSWCCSSREKYKCKAKLLTEGKSLVLKNIEHNHPDNFKGSVQDLVPQIVHMVKYITD